jgi:hypothetical protein
MPNVPADGAMMTADRLTLAAAAAIIDRALRSKAYRSSALGQLVGRYIRWFRNEWSATPESIRDYESILSKMALKLAHREPLEVDVEDLRAVIDHFWSDASARTRQKATSVIRAFWAGAENEAIVPFSPAARLRRPRASRNSVANVCRARCMLRPLVTPCPTKPAAWSSRYHQRCTA